MNNIQFKNVFLDKYYELLESIIDKTLVKLRAKMPHC